MSPDAVAETAPTCPDPGPWGVVHYPRPPVQPSRLLIASNGNSETHTARCIAWLCDEHGNIANVIGPDGKFIPRIAAHARMISELAEMLEVCQLIADNAIIGRPGGHTLAVDKAIAVLAVVYGPNWRDRIPPAASNTRRAGVFGG